MGLFGKKGLHITFVGSEQERQNAMSLLQQIGNQLEAKLNDTPSEYVVLQAAGMHIAIVYRATNMQLVESTLKGALNEAQRVLAEFGIERRLTDTVLEATKLVAEQLSNAVEAKTVTSRAIVGNLETLLDFLESQHLPSFREQKKR